MFYGIAGLIGAGKTTLASRYAHLGWEVFYEPVENNPYLNQFYESPKSVAFKMELYLLGERLRSHLQAAEKSRTVNVIEDRTIYEDIIFVNILEKSGILTSEEASIYRSLAENVFKTLPRHSLIYYLKVTPERCLEQIEKRNRGCEKTLPLEYLKSLHEEYEKYMSVIRTHTQVVEVTPEQFDNLLVSINEY